SLSSITYLASKLPLLVSSFFIFFIIFIFLFKFFLSNNEVILKYGKNLGLNIHFDVSYAQRSAGSSAGEGLQVFIYGQCDDTIAVQVYSKFDSNLATAPATSSSWVPSSPSDWRSEFVSSVDPSIIGQSVSVV